jgi:benzoyl-CoA reductase subunit C
MGGLLGKIGFVFEDPYKRVKEEKSKGTKVIGISPMYFPQELVHAANCLPVILQASKEPITLGYSHYYHFFCGVARGIVDLAARGKLDFLDGFILSDMCFEMRHVADPLGRLKRFPIVYMQWPLEENEKRWKDFIIKGLQKCSCMLEKLTGEKITDKAVAESVSLYNQNRALLREIYRLRKTNPVIISAKHMSAVVISSMVMPVMESNKLLSELISAMKMEKPPRKEGVKVHLSGHFCHEVKEGILDLVENCGGIIVSDDLYTGLRYINSDVTLNGSYLEAFALRFLHKAIPCPTQVNRRLDWAEYVIDGVKKDGAEGVIMFLAKNCEPHMIAYPHVKRMLESSGVPHLLIEVEHEMVSTEGIRTRIQAFIEMLKEGRI